MLAAIQISDLHRSAADPVTNAQLLATILTEHDRARASGMPPVGAVIVCGDIIQGCSIGTATFDEELRTQYGVALDLLRSLSKELLEGDTSRLVVVPGNHDVCWNSAWSSMVPASEADTERARNLLAAPGTPFRWNWETRTLLRIHDEAKYAGRLGAFRRFFGDLYGKAPPEAINDDAWLYDLGDVTCVAFNSCYRTDCFNRAAAVNPETIGHVATRLRATKSRLRLAVWHHNIEGPPSASDYLDQSCVRQLIYHGMRLGLHGHQHYASTAPVYVHTDRDEVMAVVSAASLCAGRRALPPGRLRGFNLLMIDADSHQATVRSLAMDLEARAQPEYGFNGGSAERVVKWTDSPTDGTRSTDVRVAVEAGERAYKESQYQEAATLLSPHFEDLPEYGRALLLDSLIAAGEHDVLLSRFEGTLRPEEVPRVLASLHKSKRTADSRRVLDRHEGVLLPDAVTYYRRLLKVAEGE